METFAINGLGKVRRVIRNGREYLVAPATSIVPGVLNGSKGALYYSPAEISRNYSDWDDQPITVYHPYDPVTGKHLSARDEGVVERQGIGFLRNSKYRGKLIHEAWFDSERTRTVDNRVYEALVKNRPLELSTGLFTDNFPAPPGSHHNGKPYDYVAANYKPDHLAVLPDQVGACSLNDGCGVLINKGNFRSEQQRKYLWSQEPDIAESWAHGEHTSDKDHKMPSGPGDDVKGPDAAAAREKAAKRKSNKVENMNRRSVWQKLGEALGVYNVAPNGVANAAPGLAQPRGGDGRFGAHGAGVGSGPAHEGAVAGGAHPKVETGDHDDDDSQEDDEDAEALEKGMSVEELRKQKKVENLSWEASITANDGFESDEQRQAFFGMLGSAKSKGGGEAEKGKSLSEEATKRSGIAKKVNKDRQPGEHAKAAAAHSLAAAHHEKAGNKELASFHKEAAASHTAKGKSMTGNKAQSVPSGDAPAKLVGKQHAKDGRDIGGVDHEEEDDYFGEDDDHQSGPGTKTGKSGATDGYIARDKPRMASQAGVREVGPRNCSVTMTRENNMDYGNDPHAISKQAAGASVAAEHGPARDHAMTALDHSGDDNSPEAAGAHVNAAKEHEKQATTLRKKGKGMDAEQHDQAAALHRKAASMHSAVTNAVSSNERQTPNKGVPMTREQKIARLTANCKCDEDRQAFNQLSDEAIDGLIVNTAGAMGNPSEEETAGGYEDGSEDGYDDETAPGVKPPKNVKGKGKKGTTTNLQQWEASMPEEARRVWNVAKQVEHRERLGLVRRLVSNIANDERRKQVGNRLMLKSIDELQELALLVPVYNQQRQSPEPLYFGANGGPAVNDDTVSNQEVDQENDVLSLPTINWAEARAEQDGYKQARKQA